MDDSSDRRPCLVVGYDGSETAITAVTYAAERAGRHGQLYIVHAVGPVADWVGATDEIVVGSRGQGRLGSLLGSVSEDVLRHAECPVVVIPYRAVRARTGAHS